MTEALLMKFSSPSPTQMARAVLLLQRVLPLARVVYASATGVTSLHHLRFMERLGLWGPGMPFRI